MAIFPNPNWLTALCEKLNTDEQYGRIAQKWEGDFLFVIEAASALTQPVYAYIDLWHGKCRETKVINDPQSVKAAFTLSAPYPNLYHY